MFFHSDTFGRKSNEAPATQHATSRMQTTFCASDLPQWGSPRNPEHQTRRHLEHAAETRMKILRRRLDKQEEQLHRPPFIASPSSRRADGPREEIRRSSTPPPSRGRSPFSRSGAYSVEIQTRGRPRSASPLRGERNSLLTNDFVQWAPTGIYRNLEQRWEMDHLSVSERLNKISSLCQDFKHQYTIDEGMRDSHQTSPPPTYRGPVLGTVTSRPTPLSPPQITSGRRADDTLSSSFRFTANPQPADAPLTNKTTKRSIVSRPRSHLYSPPDVSIPFSTTLQSSSPPSHTPHPSSTPHHLFSPAKSIKATIQSRSAFVTQPQRSTQRSTTAPLAFGHRVVPAVHEISEARDALQRTSAFLSDSHPNQLDGMSSFPSMQAEAESVTSTSRPPRKDEGLDRSWPEIFNRFEGSSNKPQPLYILPETLPEYAPPLSLVPKSSTVKFELRVKSPRTKYSDSTTIQSPLEGLSHRERLQAGIRELQAEMSRLRQDLSPVRGSPVTNDLASTIPGLGWAVRVPPTRMSPQRIWG